MEHKRRREELTYDGGQGQKPGGPHAGWAAAKRRYHRCEVRGHGGEELHLAQGQGQQPGGATSHQEAVLKKEGK